MTPALPAELTWWVSAVELPLLTSLFWLVLRARKETDSELAGLRQASDGGDSLLREALAAYKLEVAKTYASIQSVKEIERQLIHHLMRIEAKLDAMRRHDDER